MEETYESELSAEKKADLLKQCDEYLAAMQRIHEQMVKEQSEIDQITAETWEILAQLRKAA